MSKATEEKYYCDNCGNKLKSFRNSITIVTEKNDENIGWSRLRVVIEHHHGSHNNGETDPADLCQKCTIELLEDALKRVKKGERASKGVESSDMLKFNQPF